MKNLLALILFLVSFSALADEWTEKNTNLELTYAAVTAIDWMQTRKISASTNESLYETNSILGRHPTRGRVDGYFVSMLLAHYGVARILPQWARTSGQIMTIGVEFSYVAKNYQIGIRVGF